MSRVSILIMTVIIVVGSVVFANAQTNVGTKLSEQDSKIISNYEYKAIAYSSHWNPSIQKFETLEKVFYFKRWMLDGDNKWTADCVNKGIYVILEDGVWYVDGKLQKFTSYQHSNG